MNKKQVIYIVKRVCEHFDVDSSILLSKRRDQEYVFMRFHLMKLLRSQTDLGVVDIGKIVGRDHSTVIHGISEHNNLCRYNTTFKEEWEKLYKLYIEDISIEVDIMESIFTEDQLFDLSNRLNDIMRREKELLREKESVLLEILNV